MIEIRRNVAATQAKNCWLCLHVGDVAIFVGRGWGYGARIEILTPLHRWRWHAGRR